MRQRRMLAIGGAAVALLVAAFALWARFTPSTQALFQQGVAALKVGDRRKAERILRELQSREDAEPASLILAGGLATRQGDPRTGLSLAGGREPPAELREPALLFSGEALYRLGRYGHAAELMRQVIDENPDCTDAYRWLGAIYYDLGANDQAIVTLKKVVQLDPGDYRPHRLLGVMYQDFEQYQDAVLYYRQALALAPPDPIQQDLRTSLAECLCQRRDYAAALAELEAAPSSAAVHVVRAEALWSLGREREADAELQRAASLDPRNRGLLYLRARMALGEDRPEDAIEPLQTILEKTPYHAETRFQLATAFQLAGRSEEYEAEIERWREAKTRLERLTELNLEAIRRPNDAKLRRELAEVCEQLGKTELAAMWRRAAAAYGAPDEAVFGRTDDGRE